MRIQRIRLALLRELAREQGHGPDLAGDDAVGDLRRVRRDALDLARRVVDEGVRIRLKRGDSASVFDTS